MNNLQFHQIYDFEEAKKIADGYAGTICAQTKHILLGNGFSRAFYDDFSYTSLFDAVKEKKDLERIQEIFEYLGTSNFEGVLQLLQDSSHLANIYGLENADINNDYETLKNALAEAITQVHPHNTGLVPEPNKKSCFDFLKQFDNCFSVNYDLLLYWVVMMQTDDSKFGDCFTREEDTPEEYCEYIPGSKSKKHIYFLHGALHILQSRGQVFKRVWKTTGRVLIDQIKQSMNEGKYPLVVTEGESQSKLKQIKENQYLNHAFRKLSQLGGQFFSFGFSFSEQDRHIFNAIACNKSIRVLWVGIRGDFSRESNQRILGIVSELKQTRKDILAEYPSSPRSKDGELEVNFFDTENLDIWGKDETALTASSS